MRRAILRLALLSAAVACSNAESAATDTTAASGGAGMSAGRGGAAGGASAGTAGAGGSTAGAGVGGMGGLGGSAGGGGGGGGVASGAAGVAGSTACSGVGTWSLATPLKPSPFFDATWEFDCAAHGGQVFVYGGKAAAQAPPASASVFDGATKSWAISTPGGPSPAFFAGAAAWIGDTVLHFGGGDTPPSTFVNTLFEYNPSTMTWSQRKTPPLTPRGFATSVWTGSRLLVWGGAQSFPANTPGAMNVAYSDGASYDPAADSWTPLASANAPTARGYHIAVWTGERMIVWGGADHALTGVPGGALYDPATDSWSPMATVGEPSPRVGFGWAWTAGKLYVWGGSPKLSYPSRTAGVGELGDGASYDPVTDTWKAMATTGALPARTGIAMASDGTKLLLWGGKLGGPGVATPSGALYELSTGTWTTTSDCIGTTKIYNNGHCLSFLGDGFVSVGGTAPGAQWFVAP